ncbi:calcium-transporting P-type ATPase, PMR1-type [Mechercharimyces sp. CAU 1602]|uniref:calcium-transporting P-type ATPase, PMR1-type n=1 Tax=Mechercharimyces sp. CAU 1602 TaxID=2973933 RepID=UPI0021624898|nr:calcium-transporting P-type ATPase, PMR1-type [Mechercharimyces sp. CAU 1602]MCS1350664.1 calcium-transporting P-type ATPase, PMR1-type [Mechercharimyces sp. CAU 1602]
MSEKSRWLDWDVNRVLEHFNVRSQQGLSHQEAEERLKKIGFNQLTQAKKASFFSLFIDQFRDFMVLVLLAATLISGLLGEYTDAIAIIAIVIINAILGLVQEYRAEKSLDALKQLSAPTAKVIRASEINRITSNEVVPGDIVLLESGDRVPADVRIIRADNLHIEEAALTGESLPVEKSSDRLPHADVPLGDRTNLAYMGTMVVQGTGRGIVVATGMGTEMGRIAHLIESTEEVETPLKRRLEQLGKILIVIALLLTVVVVMTGIWHGQEAYNMFLAGVSLAVAAIPEGLPAIVTIALALGVQRMIRRRAIVRKLPSVETLGCASIICSDKTGTLTTNKMTVTNVWADGSLISVKGTGYEPTGAFLQGSRTISPRHNHSLQRLLEISILCNNAQLVQDTQRAGMLRRKQANWRIEGDPTEGALLVAGVKGECDIDALHRTWKRVREYPFDSNRKMMSVLVQRSDGKQQLLTKGAPEVILARCSHLVYKGRITLLNDTHRRDIAKSMEELARKGLRNLAFAYREVAGSVSQNEQTMERNLVFIGLAAMIDPPREEVKESIRRCHQAGIQTVMITGDHHITAEAIARQIGIYTNQDLAVNGSQLQQMSDEELDAQVNQIRVYARVSPEHKLRVVKSLQRQGHVVAMTGDGVNDAPAIKAADIGIAMGTTGTDVSKEASALVLADDNFSTIVAAIEEGRSIYDNIRKFISYLLASNVGEILVMFLAMLVGLPLPLVPIQILWVNLVTDGLPAMALGVDPAEENTMKRPPRNSRESIFARGVGWKIMTRGLLIGLSTLAAFWVSYTEIPSDLMRAQTIAFATLVFAQLIYVFDCRSQRSVFARSPWDNRWLLLAVTSSALLLMVVMYYPPLQPIFHTVSLDMREWILVIIASALPTLLAGLLDTIVLRRHQYEAKSA